MNRIKCDAVQVPRQTRKIRPTRRSVSGIFSFRAQQSIPFESTLERDFLIRKEFSRIVLEIYLDRANTNLTGPLEKIKDGTTWPGVRPVSASDINDIHVTHTQEPSGTFSPEEISDDEFVVLGKPRKISRITRETTGNREKPPPIKQAPADKFSGGANHGKGQDVAPATITAPETTDVDETMIEVWKALKEMSRDSRSLVNEVISLWVSNTRFTYCERPKSLEKISRHGTIRPRGLLVR